MTPAPSRTAATLRRTTIRGATVILAVAAATCAGPPDPPVGPGQFSTARPTGTPPAGTPPTGIPDAAPLPGPRQPPPGDDHAHDDRHIDPIDEPIDLRTVDPTNPVTLAQAFAAAYYTHLADETPAAKAARLAPATTSALADEIAHLSLNGLDGIIIGVASGRAERLPAERGWYAVYASTFHLWAADGTPAARNPIPVRIDVHLQPQPDGAWAVSAIRFRPSTDATAPSNH